MIAGMRRFGSGVAHATLDFIVPIQCPICRAFVRSTGLCPTCWPKARFIGPPFCARCGLPFDYDAGADSWCGACVSRSPPFERARAAMTYDDLSRDFILAFKHGDRLDLAPLAVSWLCAAGAALLAHADAVVPVPMHPRRLLRRRYNQAAVLAQGLGAVADIDVVATALRRTRRTPTQSGLGRTAREKNLRRAIAPSEAGRPRLAGRNILLIDDVLTTGATVTACSHALLGAGALRVDVLTLARVI